MIKEHLQTVMTKEKYDMWIEPIKEIPAKETGMNAPILFVPNIYFKDKIQEILKEQNLIAGVMILSEKIQNQEQKPTQTNQSSNTTILKMGKPYGKEKVATSNIINSKFFAYPTVHKKKYYITDLIIDDIEYIVHRGKKTPNPDENPIGQLDTNHLRILLAIIHTWQEQKCKFLGINAVVKISFSIREIAKKIGYKISGQNIKWLQQKFEEITKYPITLERKHDGKASSFTFLNELTIQTEEKNSRKNTMILTLNPILSKELYERKAILRNKDCYKIKNPTALKFLLTYDKRIYAAQEPFKLSLEEIAEELELKGKKQDKLKVITKVIKNLNGYKITETKEIDLELVKEEKKRYLVVGKRDTMPALPEGTAPIPLSS
jgi:hypothetical protein